MNSVFNHFSVTRPKPLSTTVNKIQQSNVVTKATLLQAVLDKTYEVKRETAAQSGIKEEQQIQM